MRITLEKSTDKRIEIKETYLSTIEEYDDFMRHISLMAESLWPTIEINVPTDSGLIEKEGAIPNFLSTKPKRSHTKKQPTTIQDVDARE